MSTKEFRELQLSSSQLVIIFLAIITLGIVIFLLGVSTGKKHAQMAAATQLPEEKMTEQVIEEKPVAVKPTEAAVRQEEAIPQKVSEEIPPPPQPKVSSTIQDGLYYVQVGAFNDKPSATRFVERFRGQGYPVFVFDPLPSDRKPVFRVRIGGFETREQAEEANSRLTPAGKKSDYFIIRYQK